MCSAAASRSTTRSQPDSPSASTSPRARPKKVRDKCRHGKARGSPPQAFACAPRDHLTSAFYFRPRVNSITFCLLAQPLAHLVLRRLAAKLRAQAFARVVALAARRAFERVVRAPNFGALSLRLA